MNVVASSANAAGTITIAIAWPTESASVFASAPISAGVTTAEPR